MGGKGKLREWRGGEIVEVRGSEAKIGVSD